MPAVYAAADLVVCRAGAMTVAELAVAGVPAVLVPLPGAPGDHQTANARVLERAGAAVLLPDPECTPTGLATVVEEPPGSIPDRLEAMGRAARSRGPPRRGRRPGPPVVEANARGRGPAVTVADGTTGSGPAGAAAGIGDPAVVRRIHVVGRRAGPA